MRLVSFWDCALIKVFLYFSYKCNLFIIIHFLNNFVDEELCNHLCFTLFVSVFKLSIYVVQNGLKKFKNVRMFKELF